MSLRPGGHVLKRHYRELRSGRNAPSLQVVGKPSLHGADEPDQRNVAIDCGWGRLIFGQTFTEAGRMVQTLRSEKRNKRDVAFYLLDPHVVLGLAPQELFLDPSHTYRLNLTTYLTGRTVTRGFQVRKLQRRSDTSAINGILKKCRMVSVDPRFIWEKRDSSILTYVVAEDPKTGAILGTVMGIDHAEAFGDPEGGSSLWCLAVDPQAGFPGVGRALVAWLADYFAARGRQYLDLSVMHDNREAIRLYEDMNFRRVPVFCVKRKNPINETLFTGPGVNEVMNVYAQIIIDEARRRGIGVNILDVDQGYFELVFGGRSIVCRESLSELTSAVALSRCDDKMVTNRLLRQAGLSVPAQQVAGDERKDLEFLQKHARIVIKPVHAEQGHGISVGVTDGEEMKRCIQDASRYDHEVLLEQQVGGDDLRIIVIDFEVVAAAVRRPPQVAGNGYDSIATLIKKQSRRRETATQGESRIPVDAITRRCIAAQGRNLEDVPGEGEIIRVRQAANLHTGGTIHDVTDLLHPDLRRVATAAADALKIPVVGLDLMVPDVSGPVYHIIEANERPGLANHEPQPTAERFIDLLFPQTRRMSYG